MEPGGLDDLDRPPALSAPPDPEARLEEWLGRLPYAVGLSVACLVLLPIVGEGGLGYGLALLLMASLNGWVLGRGLPREAESYLALVGVPLVVILVLMS